MAKKLMLNAQAHRYSTRSFGKELFIEIDEAKLNKIQQAGANYSPNKKQSIKSKKPNKTPNGDWSIGKQINKKKY